MEYLHEFATQAQCSAYMDSEDYKEPFVGLVNENDGVHYNKLHDYSRDYLTFKIISGGTLNFRIEPRVS